MNTLQETIRNPILDREKKYCVNCGKRSFTFAKKCLCGGAFVPDNGKSIYKKDFQSFSELTSEVVKEMIIQIMEQMKDSDNIQEWEVNFLYRLHQQNRPKITKGTEQKLQELFNKWVLLDE